VIYPVDSAIQLLNNWGMVKMAGFPRTETLTTFLKNQVKGFDFMDILPHLGRSNNPSLNIDKKEFGSPVITGES